jgi:hypothetical protein
MARDSGVTAGASNVRAMNAISSLQIEQKRSSSP